MHYEIIVVGAGHAGVEACIASSRKGHKTLLITSELNNIATMPCNPSIGGSAKGIVVREIDALGGIMGKVTDKTLIQLKMLNSKKGPGVRSLRAQADKVAYPNEVQRILKNESNLEIKEALVEDLIIENNKVIGVILDDNTKIYSSVVILTTGTYLKADILIGNTRKRSGPGNTKPSNNLSDKLKSYGLSIQRLKTGTPPRIDKSTIDFSKVKKELGDNTLYTFSFDNKPSYKIEEQEPCYLTYTTSLTHQIIKDNLNKSSMYGGFFEQLGIGPRYCPSIEDKIVRFIDKERHQLFLEPESRFYDDIYIQGFSTSMPIDVQEQMVRSLPGLENAKILKYAYAIEYDAIDPLQMKPSLENMILENLFTAGQINGTSGYEEAACQGLMAGINASLKLENKEPLIIKRHEGYIGVLIDDLVTKGTNEPYRLLTSRAEYRLLLRHDNADLRLREYGHSVGLINEEQYSRYINKIEDINLLENKLKEEKIIPNEMTNNYLIEISSAIIKDGISLYDLLRRPEINMEHVKHFLTLDFNNEVLEEVEIEIKYKGYINKIKKEAEALKKYDEQKLPDDIDYNLVLNLATEARQKLNKIRPTSIGQAMRISGVNPSDISILVIYLKKVYYGSKYF